MKKYLLLILFSFLIFSNLFAKNTSFSKNKSYERDFKWGFIEYSFPEGQWTFFNKDIHQESDSFCDGNLPENMTSQDPGSSGSLLCPLTFLVQYFL